MIYPSANPLHQMQVRYYYFHRQNTYMVFLTFIWQTIVKSLCNVILSTRPSRHLDFQTSLGKDWSSPNTITRISTYRDHSALFRVELPLITWVTEYHLLICICMLTLSFLCLFETTYEVLQVQMHCNLCTSVHASLQQAGIKCIDRTKNKNEYLFISKHNPNCFMLRSNSFLFSLSW